MRVTIYDLAREAGVGIGTVSRCLNNHPNVSAPTRARVLSVVRRLNYQPHAYAQRLANRKTNTVAAIIPYFTSSFFFQVLQGVQDRAAEAGLDLILYGVNDPAQKELCLRKSLQRGKVDGVMLFSLKLPVAYAERFQQMGLPLVLVDTFDAAFDSIYVENREGAQAATGHLLSLGHRSLAMISAHPDSDPARDRIDGFRDALAAASVEISADQIILPGSHRLDGFSREAGREAFQALLPMVRRSEDPVTAAFVASDVQAIGVVEAARDYGVSIPDDLAVVSFDDIELAQHYRLTTMRQPMYEMGALAIERLVQRFGNPCCEASVTSFRPQLVIRDSCGAARKEPYATP